MAGAISQATVFQEFTTVIPEQVSAPMLPLIMGPQAGLHRYAVADEMAAIALGPYINLSNNNYAWPDQAAGSIIDLSYFKLFMNAVLLRYYQHLQGAGGFDIEAVSGFVNQIKTTAADGFKANGVSFPRLAALGDRDVQIGDVVNLVYNTTNILYTTVAGFVADVIAASIGGATSDSGNAATQSESASGSQTSGTSNDVILSTTTGTAYNGLATGNINETYVVTVTQGSTGGDATTALFSVTSASGLDNAINQSFAAFNSPTAVGSRGLTGTWTKSSDNFVIGQVFTLVVAQAFTAPVPTDSGAFTGQNSPTYIITVTLGGKYSDSVQPQITVTTNIGTDASGPTTVTASASNVSIGTLGVLLQFSGTGLRKGDIYYVPVTGPSAGAYKTLVLNNNLPTAMQAASDMTLNLSLQKNIPVIQQRLDAPPALAWTVTQEQITINSGITATDPSFTNSGVQFYVPLVSGPNTQMYAQYREWLAGLTNQVGAITVPVPNGSASTVDTVYRTAVAAVLGIIDPDNPLAYAVYKAVSNSNGQPIDYLAIADPNNETDWANAFPILVGLPIYSIVPLSYLPAVQEAAQAFVDTQSEDTINGAWCRTWLSLQATESLPIAAIGTDGNPILATLTNNPYQVGTNYTYLVVTSGNANFVTAGVQPGDVVEYLFTVDAFGNTSYTSFVVAQVLNEDILILASPGNGGAVNTAQQVQIWRNLTTTQIATNLAAQVQVAPDARVLWVWPDLIETTEGEVAGYYLTAAFAGFTAGIAPHQGMQGIPITGFLSAQRSVNYFNNAQLNILAAAGVFVVTQDGDNNVFVRNALTSDQSSIQNGLEVIQRDQDCVQLVLYNALAELFGVTTATTDGLVILGSELASAAQVLQTGTQIARLGSAITSFDLVSMRVSTVVPDNIVAQANVGIPFPAQSFLLSLDFAASTGSS